MALEKITPTHQAMEILRKTIKELELKYQALAATLPTEKETKKGKNERYLVNPLTGEKGYF